jgi:hypothetical protein
MKKYLSLLSLPAINIGAIFYAQLPAFDLFEEIFKLLLLIATLLFTVAKIIYLLKDRKKDKDYS